MCYNTKQSKKPEQLEKRFKAKFEEPELFSPHNEIQGFTFPKTAIITNKTPDIIHQFQWGLIPEWSKNESIQQYTLNAKIETLTEKPSFKGVINQRCLVLVDGFYEWQWLTKSGSKKQKYLLQKPNKEAFSFAGLYSSWINPLSGEITNSYTIVTTEADELMNIIHNSKKRMPVILSMKTEYDWLNGYATDHFKKINSELEAVSLSAQQNLF